MKILVLLTIVGKPDPKEIEKLQEPEAQAVWALLEKQVVEEIYLRQDHSGAVLVLRADTLDAARAAVDGLPMVEAGLLAADYVVLDPYPPLLRRLAAEGRPRPSWWPAGEARRLDDRP